MKKQQTITEQEGKTGFLTALSIGTLLGILTAVIVKILHGTQAIKTRRPLDNSMRPVSASYPPVASIHTPATPETFTTPPLAAKPDSQVSDQVAGRTKVFATWSPATKYIVGVFMFLTILGVIYLMRSVLPIIIFATLLAFIVQPIIDFFIRRFKFKKGLAVMVTYLLVLLILTLLPLIIIPAAIDAFNAVVNIDYKSYIQSSLEWINQTAISVRANPYINTIFGPLLTSLSNLINTTSELEGTSTAPAFALSMQTIGNGIASALGLLANVLGPVVSAVLTLVFTLLISLQISLAKDNLVNWYPTVIPLPYRDEFFGLAKETNKIWNSFLRGQLTLMVAIGVITWVGNLILGTPQPLFLAIIAGVLEIVPSVGPFLATIPAVILALMFGSSYLPVSNLTFALIIIGLYVLIQALENNLVVPYVMGDAMDLSPVIVLVACLAGGASFGVLGVFLATPVVATGRMLFSYFYRKILESGPLPPEEPEKPTFWEKLAAFFQNPGASSANKQVTVASSTEAAKIVSQPSVKEGETELTSG